MRIVSLKEAVSKLRQRFNLKEAVSLRSITSRFNLKEIVSHIEKSQPKGDCLEAQTEIQPKGGCLSEDHHEQIQPKGGCFSH